MVEIPHGRPAEMSLWFDLWLVDHLVAGALDDALTAAGGLSADEFGFYSLLRRFGPLTATQVVRWTAVRPTTVSTLVRRLQQRGHLEQRPHPEDGRSRLLALTQAGEHAHTVVGQAFLAATQALSELLGAEEDRQRRSLQRLDGALRQVAGLDPRPYRIPGKEPASEQSLVYPGPVLDADQEADVRAYIEFVQTRRPGRNSHATGPDARTAR